MSKPEKIIVEATGATVSPLAAEPPKTAKEHEVSEKSAGQRRINVLWETTQSVIALFITVATVYVSARLVLSGNQTEAAFLLLSNAFFMIVGFYFGRTNHQRTGGVGGGTESEGR